MEILADLIGLLDCQYDVQRYYQSFSPDSECSVKKNINNKTQDENPRVKFVKKNDIKLKSLLQIGIKLRWVRFEASCEWTPGGIIYCKSSHVAKKQILLWIITSRFKVRQISIKSESKIEVESSKGREEGSCSIWESIKCWWNYQWVVDEKGRREVEEEKEEKFRLYLN